MGRKQADSDVMKELNTHPIMELTDEYRSNWKNHFLRMICSKIPF
jgi:hypothetical protein